MEGLPKIESKEVTFIFPNIDNELEEIVRVAEKYSPNDSKTFARRLYERARESSLIDLTEEV